MGKVVTMTLLVFLGGLLLGANAGVLVAVICLRWARPEADKDLADHGSGAC